MADTSKILLALLACTLCIVLAHDTEEIETEAKLVYKSPETSKPVYIAEHFDDTEKFKTKWILSEAKKDGTDEDIAKYDGVWVTEEPKRSTETNNLGLVLKSKARHSAIATLLNKPFYFNDKPLIVQYEVMFQEDQECGGAYIKLLTLDAKHDNLKKFHDKTPYTIMFGPDKCGLDHKLHFIFRHKNPLNGTIEEKHAKKPTERIEEYFTDKLPHLYTLIVRPDNSFQIKVDNKEVNSGSLLDDFTPPVNPPLEIEDPDDKRPEDWDDQEKIPDPLAVKPDDWDEEAPAQIPDESDVMPEGWLADEPKMIPNPESVKPDDWDEDMDGEWEPPEIDNPKCATVPGCGPYEPKLKSNPNYKGKWLPPLINNPNYKGKWSPKLIHNPNYFNDEHPFKMAPIHAIGFELWSISTNILFDNIIISDDEEVANKWAEDTFEVRRQKMAKEGETLWGRMMKSMNYKPGWWLLYFCYCAIPIIGYIWLLVKRSRESNFWQQIVNFTVENPWIWAVYIILVGVPVLLIIYCCCFTSQEKDSKKDDDKPGSPAPSDQESGEQQQEDSETKESEPAEVAEENPDSIKDDETTTDTEGPRRRKPNKE